MFSNKYINNIILRKPIDIESYLSILPAIRYLIDNKSLSITNNVIFFVGENGTGKSTLLEAIAVAYGFNP